MTKTNLVRQDQQVRQRRRQQQHQQQKQHKHQYMSCIINKDNSPTTRKALTYLKEVLQMNVTNIQESPIILFKKKVYMN